MNYLTEEQVEKQEHLTKQRLAALKPKYNHDYPASSRRPEANLIDLMHWTKQSFGADLNKKPLSGLHCWIHNKVVIDGSFLEFAEQEKVKVECLYRDSVASWKSDQNYEHFMAQGVFKVTYKKLSFLHAALFHKGNQNEDEVSFFVIMDDDSFEEYTKFRNKFDEWLTARDREHLEIHVVGGEGQPYTRDMKWDELYLPADLKKDIRGSIEGFLNAKDLYEKKKIPWKRGILLYGDPGCGKTTAIRTIISNYDFKPVTVNSSTQTNDETISEAFEYAQDQEPGLLYFEDLDTLLSTTVSISHFLNLLDGVSTSNGILVIATANDLTRLKESVTDRPSRFDRKWEIPIPDQKMTLLYLKSWFGKSLKQQNYTEIVKHTFEHKFSYAYLKELYITSAYHAIAAGRENPNIKDITAALEQLLYDKENAVSGFRSENYEEMGIT